MDDVVSQAVYNVVLSCRLVFKEAVHAKINAAINLFLQTVETCVA